MRFDPNSDRQAVLQGPSHELLDTQLAAFKAFYLSTTSQDSEALEVTEAVEDVVDRSAVLGQMLARAKGERHADL